VTGQAERVKCLIVVDEPRLRALEAILQGDDREILTATSVPEAEKLLLAHDFAFVLLDTAPASRGRELLGVVRGIERSSTAPIILGTAHDDAQRLAQTASLCIELHRHKQALARASQAREDMLAIVSHDMRTPLSVIQTTASMLLNPKYQLAPAQVREQHERIKRNAELLNRMIGDVADLSNLNDGKLALDPQRMDIRDALRAAVAAFETPARDKGITLDYAPDTNALPALADHARLTQLFQNLLGEAVSYCKSGDRIAVSSRAQDGEAVIEIQDTGPGIATEDLPALFEASRDRKRKKIGTGLGLYISQGIVDAHGGQIRCESTPGAGATFRITLPLKEH
jgi:signal transduction histidine kinase